MGQRIHRLDSHGYSLIEIMFVVALTGVIAAIAVPMMGNSLGFFRLSGDARNVSNAIALSKMRAAAVFGRVRVFIDQPGKNFHIETWDSGTNTWLADGGGITHLSQGVRFDFAPVGTAPPNTQATIREALACKDNAGTDLANTSCIVFNSRGIPIDATANPSPIVDAIYVTDGSAVYGVTVSATGMIRTWKTLPSATPNWSVQ